MPRHRQAISVLTRIDQFNAGRDPERLALKYKALASNPFAFLRGTCHLFYEDLPAGSALDHSPAAWVCGDLHLENFGSYKGENRLVYFDLNDFDEAILAPAQWELARFLVSVLVAAQVLGWSAEDAEALCAAFLDAYAAALRDGKPRWMERATAPALIEALLDGLGDRSRANFLDKRTVRKGAKRRLRLDNGKALPADDGDRQKITKFMVGFAAQQPEPAFFEVLDIARRVAGVGSLGVERYVILVRGRGGAAGQFLLDLKHIPGSALAARVPLTQPAWTDEAQRVVSVQRRMQAVAPAFLAAVSIGDRAYVLRELLPSEDRLALGACKLRRLDKVVRAMGEIVAWDQLRSGGRQGAAIGDDWVAFGEAHTTWRDPLLAYARAYAPQVVRDWQAFRAEWALRQPVA